MGEGLNVEEGKEGGDAEWEFLADFDYLLANLKHIIEAVYVEY